MSSENIPRSCLFCAAETFPILQSSVIVNEDGDRITVKIEGVVAEAEDSGLGSESIFKSSTDITLQNDLRSIFIVRKLLELPENKCQQYLQWETEGCHDPGSWLAVCGKCNESVRECFQIYQQVSHLEQKLCKIKAELRDEIRASCDRNKSTNCLLSDDIRRTTLGTAGLPVKKEEIDKQKRDESEPEVLHLKNDHCLRKLKTRRRGRPPKKKAADLFTKGVKSKRGYKRKTLNALTGTGALTNHEPSSSSFLEPDSEFFSLNSLSVGTGAVPWDLENENMQWAASPLSPCVEEDDPGWMSEQEEGSTTKKSGLHLNKASAEEVTAADVSDDLTEWPSSPGSVCEEDDKDDVDWTPHNDEQLGVRRSPRKRKYKDAVADPIHETEKTEDDKNRNAVNKAEGSVANEEPFSSITTDLLIKKSKKKVWKRKKIDNEKRNRLRVIYQHNCDKCSAVYSYKSLLQKHKELHANNSGSACPKCGWVCEKERLKFHIGRRHPEMKRKRKRNTRPSKRTRNVKYVYKRKQIDDRVPYYCDHCELMTTKAYAIIRHCSFMHPGKSIQYCGLCETSFVTKQLLQIHMESKHPEDFKKAKESESSQKEQEQQQTCPHCAKLFASKDNLNYHILTMHNEVLLKCKKCDYQADNSTNLQIHHKRKHEARTVVCEICSKQFVHARGLDLHRRQYHGKELGLDVLQCPLCDATFPHKNGLRSHTLYVHEKSKTFCCEYCGKAFGRRHDLQNHVLLHTVPREHQYKKGPFPCEFCEAKFNVRQGLYYHMKNVHSDKYTFRCAKCGKGYIKYAVLRQHEKNCTKIGVPVTATASNDAAIPEDVVAS